MTAITPEQAQFISGYQASHTKQPAAFTANAGYVKNETKAQARDSLGNQVASERQRAVVDILTAANRNGLPGLTVQEIAYQYRQLTGKEKVPGDFTDAISKLRGCGKIEFAGKRLNQSTQKTADSWRVVAHQVRLVG